MTRAQEHTRQSRAVISLVVVGAMITAGLLAVGEGHAIAAPAAGKGASVVLVDRGRPACTIVLAAKATGILPKAAKDLQEHLREMSGANVSIVSDPQKAKGVRICLGWRPEGLKLPVEPTPESVRPDGYLIAIAGGDLVILSPRPEGVRNGVYGLLEDYLGCHWFKPGPIGRHVPKRRTVEVRLPAGYQRVRPTFEYRKPWYNGVAKAFWSREQHRQYDVWQTRNRAGGLRGSIRHNWRAIFTPSDQRTDPALAPFLHGNRRPGQGQACMSHPRAAEIAAQYFIRLFRRLPHHDFYSFSQNDGHGWCTCDACKAMGSNNAARMLKLSNAVARRLAEVFPNKGISILPYSGTIEPPKKFIRGHGSLAPVICSIHMEQVKPKTDPACAEHRRRVERWMTMLPRAWSYDYIGHFPGPWVLFNKVQLEHDYYRSQGFTGIVTEYRGHQLGTDLVMWLALQLAWDSRQRVSGLLDEFYPAYFGAAGPAVRRIYEDFERNMVSVGSGGNPMDVPKLYPAKKVDAALAALNAAKRKVAGDATRIERLERNISWLSLTKRWLKAWDAHTTYRSSAKKADGRKSMAAAKSYLELFSQLKGRLALGRMGQSHVVEMISRNPGTYFDRPPGAFSYSDSMDGGGNVRLHAKRCDGFFFGRYGLCLRPRSTGTLVYDMRTGGGLRFKNAQLENMYLYQQPGVRSRIDISVDQGKTWTVISKNRAMSRGQLDLPPVIANRWQFLLRFTAWSADKEVLILDRWGVRGTTFRPAK